jgi:hypothetical protein
MDYAAKIRAGDRLVTTDDFAAYGLVAVVRDRAVAAVEAALEELNHGELIEAVEARGLDGAAALGCDVAATALELDVAGRRS